MFEEIIEMCSFMEYCEQRYQEIKDNMKNSTDPMVIYYRENLDAKDLLYKFRREWEDLRIEAQEDFFYNDLVEKNILGDLLDNPNSWT